MSWYWIVFSLSLTVFLPCLVGGFLFRRLDKSARWFFFLLLTTFVTEVAAHLYRLYFGNNLVIYSAYTFISALLIGRYLYEIRKEKNILYAYYWCAAFTLVEFVVMDFKEFNSYSTSVLSIVTIAVLLYIFRLMANNKASDKMLWINAGLIFYFISNFIYFFTARYLQQYGNMDYLLFMVIVRAFTNTICYTLYTLSLWKIFA
jgi:hypothetical protein